MIFKLGAVASTVSLVIFGAGSAAAASLSECNAALIVSTYNKIDASKSDWRMATFVDKEAYNKIKESAGASAVIYGVPVGANYDQFRESIDRYKTSTTESFSQEQFHNISWTGLGAEAADAYKECIRQKSRGLYIVPDKATDSDLSFRVVYGVVGGSPNPLPVKWMGAAAKDASLPGTVSAGEKIIVIDRPAKSSMLALNDDANAGFSDSLILTPLPPPIPPEQKFANRCVITQTDDPGPVTRGNSFSWTCDRLRAGTYAVSLSVVPSAARPVRLNWHSQIKFIGDKETEVFDLAKSSGGTIDTVNAGIGTSFQSNGNNITVKQSGALPVISVFIDNTWWHMDFANQSNDPINIPKNVSISVIGK
ncbi:MULTISPECIES: hypothetical protein [unclassified Bradyrhizobium]|uniref:hypothetical protein n=1 Tax=unclassified Bradyrhizobium TaxID=2631580 RepID=UPI0028E55BB3|nr:MULTISPECIES: hypothetical protein [unclassified Bradyrhizobium]